MLRSYTTNSHNIKVPNSKTKLMSSSIFVNGPEMWNELPNELKMAQSHNHFKGSIKRFLLCKYHKKTECSNPLCKDKQYHLG